MAKKEVESQFSSEHEKNMFNIIKDLSYVHSTWTVFSDFLTMASCSISNSVDLFVREKREALYMDTIKKYTKEEANKIAELFAELVLTFEEVRFKDVLGDMYSKLNLYSSWNGQYFTPYHLCKFIGDITSEHITESYLKRRNFINVSEPCVGSGALVIGFCDSLNERNISYQDYILVHAVDIDIRAVQMAYIQLSLLGVPAIVYCANTLSEYPYGRSREDKWYTPMYFIKGFSFKKQNELSIKLDELKRSVYSAYGLKYI